MHNVSQNNKIFCGECGSKKNSKFCDKCNKDTSNLYEKNFQVSAEIKPSLRGHMTSKEKVRDKPKRETKFYCGTKNKNVESEIEILREENTPTKVFHRLWKQIKGRWVRSYHNHLK